MDTPVGSTVLLAPPRLVVWAPPAIDPPSEITGPDKRPALGLSSADGPVAPTIVAGTIALVAEVGVVLSATGSIVTAEVTALGIAVMTSAVVPTVFSALVETAPVERTGSEATAAFGTVGCITDAIEAGTVLVATPSVVVAEVRIVRDSASDTAPSVVIAVVAFGSPARLVSARPSSLLTAAVVESSNSEVAVELAGVVLVPMTVPGKADTAVSAPLPPPAVSFCSCSGDAEKPPGVCSIGTPTSDGCPVGIEETAVVGDPVSDGFWGACRLKTRIGETVVAPFALTVDVPECGEGR